MRGAYALDDEPSWGHFVHPTMWRVTDDDAAFPRWLEEVYGKGNAPKRERWVSYEDIRAKLATWSIAEFDAMLGAELRRHDGAPVPPVDLLKGLFADMRPDPVMFDLVEDLRRVGLRVALLSNSWGNTYPREHIDALFDPVVISGEVGMRKPDPDIFEHLLARLGVPADRVVFVDDAEPNTEGAGRVGLHTVLHTHPDTTRKELSRLIPGLDSDHHSTEPKENP